MKPEGSLSCSQEPVTGLCSEPDESMYLHTQLHIPSSSDPLSIAVKLKAKWKCSHCSHVVTLHSRCIFSENVSPLDLVFYCCSYFTIWRVYRSFIADSRKLGWPPV